MPTEKPYLAAAVICEKVLQEKDGVLSAIRIVDKVVVEILKSPPEGIHPVVQLAALVSFKSGDAKGEYHVRIVLRSPSGKVLEAGPPLTAVLKGLEQGQNFILNFDLGVGEEGLYWLDVLLDGELVTSMPLRVELKQADQPGKPSQ